MGPSVERLLTKFTNGSAALTKVAAMPIYGKNTLKIFLSRMKKALRLNLGIKDSRSTRFVQMVILAWPLTFLRHGQIRVPMHLCGENIEKLFSQNVLKSNGYIMKTF